LTEISQPLRWSNPLEKVSPILRGIFLPPFPPPYKVPLDCYWGWEEASLSSPGIRPPSASPLHTLICYTTMWLKLYTPVPVQKPPKKSLRIFRRYMFFCGFCQNPGIFSGKFACPLPFCPTPESSWLAVPAGGDALSGY